MSSLSYSQWHRTLGYSFFAMDIDYIEVRNNQAVGVIEASLCTKNYKKCEGINGVFNRFLRETGGFQLEMAYWVSKWLNVPAFIVCLNPLDFSKEPFDEEGKIQILSLNTGEEITLTLAEYRKFISLLPNTSAYFSQLKLELPELLEKLIKKYPGVEGYPYFKFRHRRANWLETYELRNEEIINKVKREKLRIEPVVAQFPVKCETTFERPATYELIRQSIGFDYMNLEWVEWRKDNKNQLIGRPAALIITAQIDYISEEIFQQQSKKRFIDFKNSDHYTTWRNLADKMSVDWFFVAYSLDENKINDNSRFMVWKGGESEEGNVTSLRGYTKFLMQR